MHMRGIGVARCAAAAPYPLQRGLTRAMREAAAKEGKPIACRCGQGRLQAGADRTCRTIATDIWEESLAIACSEIEAQLD